MSLIWDGIGILVTEQEDFNMTLNEFDKKAKIREKISDIDRMLKDRTKHTTIGIGSYSSWLHQTIYSSIEDDVLMQRFYKLLEERREELMDEFNKE